MVHAGPRPRRAVGPARRAFRPPRALGVIVGLGFAAWALGLAVYVASLAIGAEAGFKTFIAWLVVGGLSLLGVTFVTWSYSLSSLAYVVDDHAVTIIWGFRRAVIPIENIQRMVPGRTLDAPRIVGINWWGCHVGESDVKRLGYTLFYSTHNTPDELLYVVTAQESYALTVADQVLFAEEVQSRAAIGAAPRPSAQRSTATGIAALPFWRDRAASITVGIAVALFVALCGYFFYEYESVPNVIRFDFPDLEGIVRVGSKTELLEIVYVAGGILAANVVLGILMHARERAAGLWLLASSAMLQVVLLIAAAAALQNA